MYSVVTTYLIFFVSCGLRNELASVIAINCGNNEHFFDYFSAYCYLHWLSQSACLIYRINKNDTLQFICTVTCLARIGHCGSLFICQRTNNDLTFMVAKNLSFKKSLTLWGFRFRGIKISLLDW